MASLVAMHPKGIGKAYFKEVAEACCLPESQIEGIYACTPLQSNTMAESSIRTGASVFQVFFSLGSSVEIDRFRDALGQVVSHNPTLRTRLVDCPLGLVQVVTKEEHATQCLSGDLEQFLKGDSAQPMSFGSPLFRSAIIDRRVVLTMHHAIMDHTYVSLLFEDIIAIYNGQTPKPRGSFKDFVTSCIGGDESAAKSFWAARFKGTPAIFPNVEAGKIPHAAQTLKRKISLSRIGNGVSLSHVPSFIEAAWSLTAAIYTGNESVAFGLVLSGRTATANDSLAVMGPTIAIAPVQVNIQRNMTVESILKDRSTALRQLQVHPALQYGVPKIRTVNDAARIACGFQTLLNIRPPFSPPGVTDGITYDYMNEPNGAFGLSLSCNMLSDGIFIEAASDPTVLCERQLDRILRQFEHTLRSMTEASLETKLDQIDLLNSYDRSEILNWNSSVPETVELCVHDMFSTQAQHQPEATAVDAWDGSLTYQKLDQFSNRLAHELIRRRISTGDRVAFIFEKSLWTVVAILAIMKAGGACLPIDRADPIVRKESIISSANVKIILTSSEEHSSSLSLAPDVFVVSPASIAELPDIITPVEKGIATPEALAYIIMTSGSTGTPKGVMLEHRCLASSLNSLATRFGWNPGCRVLQFAAHVWDISMGEIFGALLSGGCICIPSDETRESDLTNFIQTSKVNWAWLTPTVLRTISPSEVPGLEALLSIGEPISAEASKTWGKRLRLFNGWGPCESSILSSVADLTPDSPFPESIGRPVGCAIWITKAGKPNELAPIGTTGEILVEGPGVARAYLNDEVKSAAAFIAPPAWAPQRQSGIKRFYRTGDLAKYNSDGSINFIGRQDSQVKIRGQRFELKAVESVLGSCDRVRACVVMTKIYAGRTELIAVICLADLQLPGEIVLEELSDTHLEHATQHLGAARDHVSSQLPSFMVPTIWIAVQQLPRTRSAKLDRAAIVEWLKKKDLRSAREALMVKNAASLEPPATEKERLLQSIWSSVLAVSEENIGRQSSFVQLGGDSILAMQVASRSRKQGWRIPVAELLKKHSLTTISESLQVINALDNASTASLSAEPLQNGYLVGSNQLDMALPSSFEARLPKLSQQNEHLKQENIETFIQATDVQASMLAVSQSGDRGFYMNFTLDFTPALDTARLQAACEQILRHHPILRTVFVQHDSEIYQVVLKSSSGQVVITTGNEDTSEKTPWHEGSFIARFSLHSDGQFCQRLRLETHHSLYDAMAQDLMFKDLIAAYEGRPLSDGLLFHSWASYVENMDITATRAFWKDTLRDSTVSNLLPPPAGAVRGYVNEQIQIRVPLSNMQTKFGTPSSTMKSAWALVLSLALDANDTVFGEVSANRYLQLPGIDQVRGPCVNYLPIRTRIDDAVTLSSLIKQVQEDMTAAIPHHHMGYRSIIRESTEWAACTRFSSMMVFQNHGALRPSLKIGEADGALSMQGKIGDSSDVGLIITPNSGVLEVDLHYCSETFPSKQILWISQALTQLLEAVPSSLDKSLSEIKDDLRSKVGVYEIPKSSSESLIGAEQAGSQSPSEEIQKIVQSAWNELSLSQDDDSETVSMFSNGADLVSALLLSEHYHNNGHHLTTEDIVKNPSRLGQAQLLSLRS